MSVFQILISFVYVLQVELEENKPFEESTTEHSSTYKLIPPNTVKTKACIWKCFLKFCQDRGYVLSESATAETLGEILADWGCNMKKANGTDYKESVVKTMWNITAKMLQEMYYEQYKVSFDPFRDREFKKARESRNRKRRELQTRPEKCKTRRTVLSEADRFKMYSVFDEDTPSGLLKKFFHIAGFELTWTHNEAANCLVGYFRREFDISGNFTGRVEYNRKFVSTMGDYNSQESKWLISNVANPGACPVRLLFKLLDKRKNSKISRLFLTPNPFWNQTPTSLWFRECPVGRNQIGSWIKEGAEKIGLDTKRFKITHYTNSPSTSARS